MPLEGEGGAPIGGVEGAFFSVPDAHLAFAEFEKRGVTIGGPFLGPDGHACLLVEWLTA